MAMLKKVPFLIVLAGLCFLISCEKDSSENKKVKDLSSKDIVFNNNSAALSSRISTSNQIMLVEDIDDSRTKSLKEPPKVDLTKNYAFKLRAEVAPPVYEGNTLQATHVKIYDKFAFVTYNTKGDTYLGGLEVFDVSDISKPKIVWQAIFPKADVSSVDYYNHKLYIVGAQNLDDPTIPLRKPAMLEVLPLDAAGEISDVDTIINLDSYAGTDVRVASEGIYTTSGSNGFLKFYSHNYDSIYGTPINDARSVDINTSNVYVLGGQPGKVSVFSRASHVPVAQYNPDGANTPESKSELAVNDKYIFTALNEGGFKMLNIDGSLKQYIPRPATPQGEKDEDYVTNSVSLNGDLVLFANGEDGLYIGGIVQERHDSIFMLGKIRFGTDESANFVESRDSVIFVATGLGGLKILSISVDEGVPDDVIPTKPCPTLYSKIIDLFPEGKNNYSVYPELFGVSLPKNLVLKKESEVYLTFVAEGAGWKNSLGYYTYNQNNPPTSVDQLEKHILFPNVSEVNEGGGLNSGDMVQLGNKKFPAGTVIGFYLISQGWNNGLVTDGRYTHYTNIEFNPGNHQQHTLFLEGQCNDIVMTFEDIDYSDNLSYNDHDFNDLIFVISDNKDPNHKTVSTAFDLTNIPVK